MLLTGVLVWSPWSSRSKGPGAFRHEGATSSEVPPSPLGTDASGGGSSTDGEVSLAPARRVRPVGPLRWVQVDGRSGRPAVGTHVMVTPAFRAVSSEAFVFDEGMTDEDGRVLLALPPLGAAVVLASREGDGGMQEVPPGLARSEIVRVRLGEAIALAGRVVAPDGQAIEGAEVRVSPGIVAFVSGLPARTGGDGTFRLPPIPRARIAGVLGYTAQARGHGHIKGTIPTAKAVDRGIEIVLEPSHDVVGQCVDAAGSPVPGAAVLAGAARATTRNDGTFRLESVPESVPVLHVVAADAVPRRIDLPWGDPGLVTVGRIVLTPGAPIRGRAVWQNDGRRGAAAVGVIVLARLVPDGPVLRSARADGSGRFLLPALGSGPWWLDVSSRMRGGRALRARSGAEEAIEGGRSDIVLGVGFGEGLKIRFVGRDGRPRFVTSAQVRVTDGEGEPVDIEGRGRFSELHVPLDRPGPAQVRVEVPDAGHQSTRDVQVEEGDEVAVPVLLDDETGTGRPPR